jgi:hypothetical protein
MKNIRCIIFLCLSLTAAGCSNPFTPAGHEGYVFESPRVFGKGGFKGVVKGPGNYGASFWRNKAINIDIRPVYNPGTSFNFCIGSISDFQDFQFKNKVSTA